MNVTRIVVAMLALVACKKDLGGACDESSDCSDGLFCAKVGELRDTCTATCAQQENICRMRWGNEAACHGGYCATKSTGAAADPCEGRCNPATMKCREEPAPPTCVVK